MSGEVNSHPIFVIDGTNHYKSIVSFCAELSRMGGVARDGHSYPIDMLVPYRFAKPELYTELELDVWFESNVRGPNFPAKSDASDYAWKASELWEMDKRIQQAWRKNAVEELTELIGYMFPKESN